MTNPSREIQESYLEEDPQGANPIFRELFDGLRDLQTAFGAGGITPAGGMIPFAGAEVPDGWLECNGQAVSRTTYKRLFDAIGTTFGVGDGSTTFNVPDVRDKFFQFGTFAQRGQTGGSSTHNHGFVSQAASPSGAGNSYPTFSSNTTTSNHLPPFVRAVALIKT